MTIGPLLGILVAAALVVWGVGRLAAPARRHQPEEVDVEELEAAEREVRDWDTDVRPEDDVPGADWGPGTPRPPTRL